MKIIEAMLRVEEKTYQPILRMTIDIPVELIQSSEMPDPEKFLGHKLIEACKEYYADTVKDTYVQR